MILHSLHSSMFKKLFTNPSYQKFPELHDLIYPNVIKGEKAIAYFRLILALLIATLVFTMGFVNKHFNISDYINLSITGIAFSYSIFVFILFSIKKYNRFIGFISSTVDITLVSLSVYFSKFDPHNSILSVMISSSFAVYIPIILYSIRRHDPFNSFFTGILAGFQYSVIIAIMFLEYNSRNNLLMLGFGTTNDIVNELIKVSMLILCGFLGYVIANNFDSLFIKGLLEKKEKEYVKDVFGKYVSDAVVDKILSKNIPIDGEKRFATVMFIDLKDFTKMSENIDPKILIKTLNSFFAFAIEKINIHNGFIDKFIGDAIMVEFGVPIYDENHKENAVKCAIDLYKSSQKLRYSSNITWNFEIGIGINSGELVLGNIGTEERMEYTALGDTVNIASRLERMTRELNKPIIIGENTYCEAIKDFIENKIELKIKGKSEPIKAYIINTEILSDIENTSLVKKISNGGYEWAKQRLC